MADLIALLQPRVTDRESLQELIEDLEDQIPGIERDIAALRKAPADRALIASLFRSLHTIKGDAAICKVDVGVMICHPIESLLSRCRDGEFTFSGLLPEVTLLALDRLELTLEALSTGRSVEHLKLPELVGGMEGMATAKPEELANRAARTIEAVTGFRPLHAGAESFLSTPKTDLPADLRFFHHLALAVRIAFATLQGTHRPHPAPRAGHQPGRRRAGGCHAARSRRVPARCRHDVRTRIGLAQGRQAHRRGQATAARTPRPRRRPA